MEEYTINDAIADVTALERGDLNGIERANAAARVRNLLHELQKTSVLVGDDR